MPVEPSLYRNFYVSLLLATLGFGLGCSSRESTIEGENLTVGVEEGGSTAGGVETSGEESATEEDGEDESGPLFDVLGDDDVFVPGGCDKVDILFVIDNSGSMMPKQESLTASFPGLVSTINEVAEVSDLHVLITDTDAGRDPYISCSGNECGCAPLPACCNDICAWEGENATCQGEPACAGYPEAPPLDECDDVLGAGKDESKMRAECGLEGQRYLEATDPDLATKFSCLAEVGTSGSGAHRVGEAATLALGELTQPGACNDGFLREDAILILVAITDAPDEYSAGTPLEWFDKVVEAKKGDSSAIVTLGLVNDPSVSGEPCSIGLTSPRMIEWLTAFDHHLITSVCEPDYSSYFAEAAGLIDEICDEFVPPG